MAGIYRQRHPEHSVFYGVFFYYFERFLREYEDRFEKEYGYFRPVIPDVVERYLDCGNPMCGFARIRCPDCGEERLLIFSCKPRGLCPFCHAKRREDWGEWIREELLLDVPHRQVVFTVPKMLRLFFRFKRKLLNSLCLSAVRTLVKFLHTATGLELMPGVVEGVKRLLMVRLKREQVWLLHCLRISLLLILGLNCFSLDLIGDLNMKKIVLLISVLSLLIFCGPKQDDVERIMEDGVEVVINYQEPYRITREPDELYLEEILTIDMEEDAVAELGLADAHTFDVDSEGHIFLFQYPREGEHLVFKFNKAGDFLMSFGDVGQGPGEIQFPGYLRMTSDDEIPIIDRMAKKLMFFDTHGVFLREIRFDLI